MRRLWPAASTNAARLLMSRSVLRADQPVSPSSIFPELSLRAARQGPRVGGRHGRQRIGGARPQHFGRCGAVLGVHDAPRPLAQAPAAIEMVDALHHAGAELVTLAD